MGTRLPPPSSSTASTSDALRLLRFKSVVRGACGGSVPAGSVSQSARLSTSWRHPFPGLWQDPCSTAGVLPAECLQHCWCAAGGMLAACAMPCHAASTVPHAPAKCTTGKHHRRDRDSSLIATGTATAKLLHAQCLSPGLIAAAAAHSPRHGPRSPRPGPQTQHA